MHVDHTKIAPLRLVYAVALIQCVLFFSACTRYVDVIPSAQEGEMMDSVLAFLEMVDESKITEAYSVFDDLSFIRTVTTSQLDEAENITSSSVEIEDAGLFVPYPLPADRGYNNARHQTKYIYNFLPDTVLHDRLLRVVDIHVRNQAAAEVPFQDVRLFIDRNTLDLIAIRLRRLSESLLYREESLIYMEGRRRGTGPIIPYRFDLQTSVKAFFSDPIRLSTSSVFEAGSVRDSSLFTAPDQ